MEKRKILKGTGIGCGAIIIWIIGLTVACVLAVIILFVFLWEPSPTMERIVAQEGDNPEMVTIGNAYLRQIEVLRERYTDVKVGYVFYDVTNDGIPELWACTSDFFIDNVWHANRLQVYTYKQGEGIAQLYQSDDIGVPSGFYIEGNTLVREDLGDVHTWVRYTYDRKTEKVVATTIPLEDYTPHGEYLNEIWRGTKTLKKMLGLQYDENEEENDTNIL